MIRRFNYTGRQRILREHARPIVLRQDNAPDRLRVELDLSTYGFPSGALVFAEAYRQTLWQRFPLGTVGAPLADQLFDLTPFGSADGVRYRVKVTSPEPPHRILGEADGMAAEINERGRATPQPILPVRGGDIGAEVWRVEVDSPMLVVNQSLPWHDVARSDEFVALVFPSAVRQILLALAHTEDWPEFEAGWRRDWLRFAVLVSGVEPPDGDTEEREQWIDDVVAAFGRRHDLLGRFAAHWKDEAAS